MMAAGNVGSDRNHSTELAGMGYLGSQTSTCLILFHLLPPNPGHVRCYGEMIIYHLPFAR